MEKITYSDWEKKGKELFGADKKEWKFKCPNCGNVQTIKEFIELNKKGIDVKPQTAFFSCIGRFIDCEGTIFDKKKNSPCNYTNGGLFNLAPYKILSEGEEFSVFGFAEEETPIK